MRKLGCFWLVGCLGCKLGFVNLLDLCCIVVYYVYGMLVCDKIC